MINYFFKYFTLNRRERNGVFALISLLAILLLAKYFIIYYYNPPANEAFAIELDVLAKKLTKDNQNLEKEYYRTTPVAKKDSLFFFDPNSINYEQALQLGFEKRAAYTLLKYRNKGGVFYKPTDLKKVYGMNDVLFDKLKPYMLIKGIGASPKIRFDKKTYVQQDKTQITIEINSADSLQWISLKGIGPGYTRMILKYKKLLGGFYATEQLKEVYHFSDSLYTSLKGNLTVNPALIQKIKVNTVDFKTMVHHPYIKYEGTKCIFALKRDKKIKAEDLIKSSCFSREQLEKVLMYLDFE